MTIHSSEKIIFSFTYIEGITLGAGEEIDEVCWRSKCNGCV